VRRERRERLLDRLLVADVGEHPAHHAHVAPPLRRQLQPARGHEREEADGPQRHGLATRVRARHDERRRVGAQAHVDRHDAVGDLFDEQRVPRLDEVDRARRVQPGAHAVPGLGELCAREDEVELRERAQ
jgi:hypothetical protein